MKTIPVDVVGLGRQSVVTAGEYHTCSLTEEGWLRCWGRNDYGQLGNGTTISKYIPGRDRVEWCIRRWEDGEDIPAPC